MVKGLGVKIYVKCVGCCMTVIAQNFVAGAFVTVPICCLLKIFDRRFGNWITATCVKHRITLNLFGNEGFDFQGGQGQQLNRLLQLRRHHQRLALAKVEARS